MRWCLILLCGCSLITDPGQFEGGDASRVDARAEAGDGGFDSGDATLDGGCIECDSGEYCLDGSCQSCDVDGDGYLADPSCSIDATAPIDCDDTEDSVPRISAACASPLPDQCRLGAGFIGPDAPAVTEVFTPGILGAPRSTYGPTGEQHGDLFVAIHADRGLTLLVGPTEASPAFVHRLEWSGDTYATTAPALPSTDMADWPFVMGTPHEVCLSRIAEDVFIAGVGQRLMGMPGANSAAIVRLPRGGPPERVGVTNFSDPVRSGCVIGGTPMDPVVYWADDALNTATFDGDRNFVRTTHGAFDARFPWIGGSLRASAASGSNLATWDHLTGDVAEERTLPSPAVGPLARTESVLVPVETATLIIDTAGVTQTRDPARNPMAPTASMALPGGDFLMAEGGPSGVRLRRLSSGREEVATLDLPELQRARAIAIDYRPTAGLVVAIVDATGAVKFQRLDSCD